MFPVHLLLNLVTVMKFVLVLRSDLMTTASDEIVVIVGKVALTETRVMHACLEERRLIRISSWCLASVGGVGDAGEGMAQGFGL